MIKLSDITVETKTAEVEYPEIPGFKVKIAAISRELTRKIKEESEDTKIDKRLRIPTKELNEDRFVQKFAQAAIKGWSGLKFKHLPDLLLVDLSKMSKEQLEEEVEFSQENAVELLKNSSTFDAWLNDQVFDIEQFRN